MCKQMINHHHHHVVPPAWISLTLSRYFSLSFITSGRLSGLHPVSSHSCCMYVELAVLLLLGYMRGSIGVHHLLLYTHLQHHNDTIIKTQWQRQTLEVFFNKILPLTLLQGFEKVVWGFTVRGSWRPHINCNILTPLLWPSRCVFLVL